MEFTNFIDFASKVGIWCACFLILAVYTLKHYEKLVQETKEDSKAREESLKKHYEWQGKIEVMTEKKDT